MLLRKSQCVCVYLMKRYLFVTYVMRLLNTILTILHKNVNGVVILHILSLYFKTEIFLNSIVLLWNGASDKKRFDAVCLPKDNKNQ